MDLALSLEACQSFVDSQIATSDDIEQSHSGMSGHLPPVSVLLDGKRKTGTLPQNQTTRKSGFDFKQSMEVVSNRPGSVALPLPSLASLAYTFEVESKNPQCKGQSWSIDPIPVDQSDQGGISMSRPPNFSCAMKSTPATQPEDNRLSSECLALPSLSSMAAGFDTPTGNPIAVGQAEISGLFPRNQVDKRGTNVFDSSKEVSSSLSLEYSQSEIGIDVVGLAGPSLSQLADSFEKSSDNPFKIGSKSVPCVSEARLGTVSESSAIPSLSQLAESFEKSSDNPFNLTHHAGAKMSGSTAMATVSKQPLLSNVSIKSSEFVHGTITDDLGIGLAGVSLDSLAVSFEKSEDNPFCSKSGKGGSHRPVGVSLASFTGSNKPSDTNNTAQSNATSSSSPTHFVASMANTFPSFSKPSGCAQDSNELSGMSLAELANSFKNSPDYPRGLYQGTTMDSGPSLASLAELYEKSSENSLYNSRNQSIEPSDITMCPYTSGNKQAATGHGQILLSDLSDDFGSSTDIPLSCISAKPGHETGLEDRGVKGQWSSGNILTDVYFVESAGSIMGSTDDVRFSGHTTSLSDGMQIREESELRLSSTRAKPSLFARILCTSLYSREDIHTGIPSVSVSSVADGDITPFDFSTPSPDDVVLSKQQQARKRTTKQRAQKK